MDLHLEDLNPEEPYESRGSSRSTAGVPCLPAGRCERVGATYLVVPALLDF